MLHFDGFYSSQSQEATIEAPTPSGEYSFQSYMMYRFYESGIWIRANSLDTKLEQFWEVSQKITSKELDEEVKHGNIWLAENTGNHSLDIGEYEIEEGIIYVSFEFRLSEDEEPIFSDMLSWKVENQQLVGIEEDEGDLDFHTQ